MIAAAIPGEYHPFNMHSVALREVVLAILRVHTTNTDDTLDRLLRFRVRHRRLLRKSLLSPKTCPVFDILIVILPSTMVS